MQRLGKKFGACTHRNIISIQLILFGLQHLQIREEHSEPFHPPSVILLSIQLLVLSSPLLPRNPILTGLDWIHMKLSKCMKSKLICIQT